MAREWLLRGVNPEELKKETPVAPETPRGKWENFWYHYKWTVLGGGFVLIAVLVMMIQLFTRDNPDYRVLLLTEKAYVSGDLEVLQSTLAQYGKDLDGDGKVEVHVQNCMLGEQVKQQYNSNIQLFQAHLMAGDVVLFAWDEKTYDKQIKDIEALVQSDSDFLTTLPEHPDVAKEGKAYNWINNSARLEMEEVCPAGKPENLLFPENLYFTVRSPIGTAEESVVLNQQALELLDNMMQDKKTAE